MPRRALFRPILLVRALYARGRALGCEGLAALEFAIVAPVMILLTLGILEFGMIMFAQSALDSATNNTARLGKTGYTAGGISQQQTIINALDSYTTGLLDPNKITITTTVYADLDDVGVNGQGTAGLGTQGQIVVYTVSYPWKIMTPLMSELIGTNGVLTLTARTVVKNEPYSN